jgi:FemAB-related protein (PEP-CTERM system-associated)
MGKVRIVRPLPEGSEQLLSSFKSKLRSQIRKPIREGLHSAIGGLELLTGFYEVFSINMRDLGSPVHSKKFFACLLNEFREHAKIFLIYKGSQPVAASLVFGFQNILSNPWSSSLKKFSQLSPNMLLYWSMLEYACDSGYEYFDFGRSTPDEGTYKFKVQWEAKPKPLYWYYLGEQKDLRGEHSQSSKFHLAISCWKWLPVSVTRIWGPVLRRHIGL